MYKRRTCQGDHRKDLFAKPIIIADVLGNETFDKVLIRNLKHWFTAILVPSENGNFNRFEPHLILKKVLSIKSKKLAIRRVDFKTTAIRLTYQAEDP